MNDALLQAFFLVDAALIAPFRLFADPGIGFACGMTVLALASALLGRLGAASLGRLQRARREREEGETRRHHELSIEAVKAGDRAAYLAANRLARDAYGNTMALAAGRAAALLWPPCAALAWAYWRFAGVPLPLVGEAVGPVAFFLPPHILAHWLLARCGRRRPKPGVSGRPPSPAG